MATSNNPSSVWGKGGYKQWMLGQNQSNWCPLQFFEVSLAHLTFEEETAFSQLKAAQGETACNSECRLCPIYARNQNNGYND